MNGASLSPIEIVRRALLWLSAIGLIGSAAFCESPAANERTPLPAITPSPIQDDANLHDVQFLDDKLGPVRNATDANLKAFQDRGGKLILYHGWNDPDISPLSSTNYYDNVAAKLGQKTADSFMRLYLVPGMQHCGGGPGATVLGSTPGSGADAQHGIQAQIERWVETGIAPMEILATKYKTPTQPEDGVVRTRPVCAYPQVARYKGTGSSDDAANFSCVAGR